MRHSRSRIPEYLPQRRQGRKENFENTSELGVLGALAGEKSRFKVCPIAKFAWRAQIFNESSTKNTKTKSWLYKRPNLRDLCG
jgi:hypothetical protein